MASLVLVMTTILTTQAGLIELNLGTAWECEFDSPAEAQKACGNNAQCPQTGITYVGNKSTCAANHCVYNTQAEAQKVCGNKAKRWFSGMAV